MKQANSIIRLASKRSAKNETDRSHESSVEVEKGKNYCEWSLSISFHFNNNSNHLINRTENTSALN
jgi:hypothetical protein